MTTSTPRHEPASERPAPTGMNELLYLIGIGTTSYLAFWWALFGAGSGCPVQRPGGQGH